MKISKSRLTEIRKLHSRKHREEMQLFVCEGARLVEEAIASGLVEYTVTMADVGEKAFKELAQTQTPQGILAVCCMPQKEFPEKGTILALDRISDPGNLGTILRTAEGAGISGVLLSVGCADLYNAKTVRATMGAIFRVPVLTNCDLADIIQNSERVGVAMTLDGADSLFNTNLAPNMAIVVGSEAHGVDENVLAACVKRVKIPMDSGESLNAAVAAGIAMYEWKRQMYDNTNIDK